MAAFMKIGDIWSYNVNGKKDYFICMGTSKNMREQFCWKIYRLEDADLTQAYDYPHEIFQRVVEEKTMILESRVKE